ncbi:BRCA1-associated RING domain protein 1 isoform X1 [Cynara cardunculus var. scolymus]|uniref:BRCA1-associated RING domain protein 1 isoform X1 n=2 Tax=Cynara cardunculus var. scolymus TaxID=59895 RepID=UPI000D62D3A6|nr:BRCA1-associated RING domain protein 1 isoform X1 [Cynara cardunculus var. scolymus]
MEEAQRLLNPGVLHLQKLGLELKCPLCLQLFNRPVLLPCTHIFCSSCMPKAVQIGSECPVCKHQYFGREVKPALFMENIVAIYRSLDATFNANLLHPVCSDDGHPASFKMDANNNPRKEKVDIAQDGNSSNRQSMILQTAMPTLLNGSAEELVARNFEKCITPESNQKQGFKMCSGDKPNLSNTTGQVVAERHMEIGVSGVGFIRLEQLSPPLSSDSKNMDGNCSDPSSTNMNAGRYSLKRLVENDAYGTNLVSNNRCTSGAKCTIEVKRQKKTTDRLNDTRLDTNGPQTNVLASENAATGKSSVDLKKSPCAFCHSSKQTEGSGPLVSFFKGKKAEGNAADSPKATHVHEKCYTWAPQIFFKDGIIQNLEKEVARANKLKCSSCGKKGAGLGCYMKSCPRTYHVPCAYDDLDCRWDCDNYLLLCPKHASHNFPEEQKSKAGKHDTVERITTHLNPCNSLLKGGKNLVLCGSALSSEEKCSLIEFARSSGTIVSKYWKPNVTHVIAAVDSNGACTRTLKVLMAILNGKWIVTVEWVKACVEAGCLVKEEPYEVHLDTHGCSGGPKAGRLRILNNGPKLFNDFHFYFIGDFVQAFKTDLLSLITTAGGTIIKTKDQLLSSSNDTDATVKRSALVVYNADLSDCSEFEDEDSIKFQRLAAAEDVARECKSQIVGHTWILESVAACSVVPIIPSKV